MDMQKDIDQARTARDMGYTIAGFIEEIFEGAEILIPDTMWMYSDSDGIVKPEYMNEFIDGKVLHIAPVVLQYDDYDDAYDDEPRTVKIKTTPHFVMHFVLETPDGLQLPISRGKGWEIFIKDPGV